MAKIQSINLKKMWGHKNINLTFNDSVNFLIGENGSGKTTVINIISYILCVDLKSLRLIDFESAMILFSDNKYIYVKKNDDNAFYIDIKAGKNINTFTFDFDDPYFFRVRAFKAGKINRQITELTEIISQISTTNYLPILRSSKSDFSDELISETPSDLINYKLNIIRNDLIRSFSRDSKNYNDIASDFQRNIFNKLLEIPDPLTFHKITPNFNIEEETLKELSDFMFPEKKGENEALTAYISNLKRALIQVQDESYDSHENFFSDIGFIFNAWRMTLLSKDYKILQNKKNSIFKRQFEFFKVFKLFFNTDDKELILSDKNELVLKTKKGVVNLDKLSSGEQQMIILLGQMYLSEKKPIVYIADEPEISLHVKWQDILVDTLLSINPEAQFIFATHSPDIVGRRKQFALKV